MVTSTSEMPSLYFLLAGGLCLFQNSKERFARVCLLKSLPLIASPKSLVSQMVGSRFFRMPKTFAVSKSSPVVRTMRGQSDFLTGHRGFDVSYREKAS